MLGSLESLEESSDRAVPGHDERRIELGQRRECKHPFVQAWVRNRQPRLVDGGALYQQKVEVDGPRPVARPLARSTELVLDGEQHREERLRLEGGLDSDRGVEKLRLVEVADRHGLVERRDCDDVDSRALSEQLDRARQGGAPVAEVRSEPHVGATHNPTLNTSYIHGREMYVQLTTMRINTSLAAITALAAVLAVSPTAEARSSSGSTIVALQPASRCAEAVFVTSHGGTLVAPSLGLYRIPNTAAAEIVSSLRSRGALRFSAPNRLAGSLEVEDFADPLVPTEWWRAVVGVDTLTPPPVGRATTIVDSGIDVSHPEFLGRANTETLNEQEPAGFGGEHGTAVASLVAAPANGLGLVGIYPEALLRSWDAAKGQGTALETTEIVQGILAAANNGPGIVNLSLGSDRKELVIEQAVYEAVRKGTLIVAASGNDGDAGNPLGYPASIPHVLTVGASDRSNGIVDFSSRSRYVDLAAPGVDMPIATARGKGWTTADGTSFAAPLVSGAAAWVWTVRPELDATQLFEVMRRSTTDIGLPGRDDAAGFGLLNVPAALAYAAPVRDPFEPNDDIEFVRPGGLYDNSIPPLTTKTRRSITLQARIDRVEDPHDVYRIWLPKNGRFTATLTTDTDVDLGLWKQETASITRKIVSTDRLARATTSGTSEQLTFANKGPGRFAFLAVGLPKNVSEATYRLRVS